MLADYHLHCTYSLDGRGTPEEMIKGGIDKGLKAMCFTDHIDLDYPYDEIWEIDFDSYFKEIRELKEKYRGIINVCIGVEIGMQPQVKEENNAIVREHDFDFVIGSQHCIGDHDPYHDDTFEGRNAQDVYRDYFNEIMKNIRLMERFSSLGHMDYACRYGAMKGSDKIYSDNAEVIDEILRYLIRHDIALEMNTSGLKKGTRNFNPPPLIFKRYRELGGELVTLGSDAHCPDDIASGFDRALEALKSVGFDHYYYYENMKPHETALER